MSKTSAVVYVVDDDESMRRALGALVRLAGLRVQTFPSAREFLGLSKAGRAKLFSVGCAASRAKWPRSARGTCQSGRSDPDYFSHRSRRHSHVGAGDESRGAGVFDQAL